MSRGRRALLALGGSSSAGAGTALADRCVAPAQPGGGFELTCLLVREALAQPGQPPLPVLHQPGGIGALVYDEVVRGRRPPGVELVAFSTGTLLNLAQGRFGRHGVDDVRWLALLARDHGVVVVHRDAPWRDLPALLRALREQPGTVAFAAGGTIGSQDWMKAALLARAAGVGPRALRLIAFEGGGDAMRALVGRHAQVLAGDAAEVARQLAQGAPLRVLAVLAPQRLAGLLAAVPTAREQGVDLGRTEILGINSHQFSACVHIDSFFFHPFSFPTQFYTDFLKCQCTEFTHRMVLSGCYHKIFRCLMLKNQPHTFHIIFGISPVAQRIQVTQI